METEQTTLPITRTVAVFRDHTASLEFVGFCDMETHRDYPDLVNFQDGMEKYAADKGTTVVPDGDYWLVTCPHEAAEGDDALPEKTLRGRTINVHRTVRMVIT